MNLAAHFETLDKGISKLLAELPVLPANYRDVIQDFLDHNEYGLAFEALVEGIAKCQIHLNNDQAGETTWLAKLMGL